MAFHCWVGRVTSIAIRSSSSIHFPLDLVTGYGTGRHAPGPTGSSMRAAARLSRDHDAEPTGCHCRPLATHATLRVVPFRPRRAHGCYVSEVTGEPVGGRRGDSRIADAIDRLDGECRRDYYQGRRNHAQRPAVGTRRRRRFVSNRTSPCIRPHAANGRIVGRPLLRVHQHRRRHAATATRACESVKRTARTVDLVRVVRIGEQRRLLNKRPVPRSAHQLHVARLGLS